MIKENQRFLNFINATSDGLIVVASYLFSVWFWLDVLMKQKQNIALIHSFRQGVGLAASLYAVAMVLLLAIFRLYDASRIRRVKKEIFIILEANAIGVLAIGTVLFAFRLQDFSRGVLAVFFLSNSLALCTKRLLLRAVLSYYRKKGYNQKHVFVVGTGKLAKQYAQSIRQENYSGFSIEGYFGCEAENLPGTLIGAYTALEEHLQESGIDEVVVALEPDETDYIKPTIDICEKCGTKVSIIPFYNDIIPSHPTIDVIGSVKLLNLRSNPLDNVGYAAIKRLGDILISAFLLLLFSPLMLFALIGIRMTSPGPILFKQVRVGRNKHNFQMLKFRSMRVNSDQETGWTTDHDPRKTRFGSFLRKFSIDELPQFFNVICGDMSIVGPRPEVPYYVEQFRESVPLYMVKHQVRPGMTGWAQVNGYRGDTSIQKRIEYDIWYIENWSLGLDLRILLQTVTGAWINKEKLK